MALPDGLYDLLLTDRMASQLGDETADIETVRHDGSERLAEIIARQFADVLEDIGGDESDRPRRQLELVNALLLELRRRTTYGGSNGTAEIIDLISVPMRVLKGISRGPQTARAPEVGLSTPWLFTAGKGSPSLLQEIRHELESADSVDILVSFITVSGVRKLQDVLQRITAINALGATATRLRILTTTYIGATEARALDQLARLPGCEVRVSLDGRRTRLHAKAWLFHRRTGFGSAYVGSANLSGAALTGGLEWTVKIAERSQRHLFARAEAHFETLWEDSEFQRYDPESESHRFALVEALRRESRAPGGSSGVFSMGGFFDLQPKSYQREMLEQLVGERRHGRRRNLVVAATGTGKTVVAAFDYEATCRMEQGRPRFLYVAHREEILRQALRTYREVLRDPSFGEVLAGDTQPASMDHLFATIDSVAGRGLVEKLGAEYWHSVVIDECHRLAANRFDTFVTAIKPSILLGLTATPERSDGRPISHYFDQRPDGAPAVELRLWHALDLQLLAPFEYYACDDETDFSAVPWDQATAEREAIDNLVTGNRVRARLVVDEWRRLTVDPRQSRALVFCVSVAHAEFMTRWLNDAGLPSECIVGTTDAQQRRSAPSRLASGALCALVTVDLFNEGIDLPFVDTLLLLRPTQSPVLFQQQIGRGLRLSTNKESCLVLDFVGQHRSGFRFDRLLSALTGLSRRELIQGVDHGFGGLPPGCHIHLQRQTRDQVLRNLREIAKQSWRRLSVELQGYAALRGRSAVRLDEFVHDQALNLTDIYRKATGTGRSGWTALQRDAGLIVEEPGPEEAYLSRRFASLLHVDDDYRLAAMNCAADSERHESLAGTGSIALQMLAYQIDSQHTQAADHLTFIDRLSINPQSRSELAQLSRLLEARGTVNPLPLPGLADTPLCLHAAYEIREILTAVEWLTPTRRVPFQAGVLGLHDRKCELVFITLDKSSGFHERNAYQDYAISADRFHWQTQNSAGPDTPGGRRYLESPRNDWRFQLFVRSRRGSPYRACGPITIESVQGDRPMSIVSRLEKPLPARFFREYSILRNV